MKVQEHPQPGVPSPHRIQESLAVSQREGVVSQLTFGIIDYYLIPFALLLGAGTQHIGWLVAIPNLLSSISQFFVVDVLKFLGDRRRVLILGSGLQALSLLPFMFLVWVGDTWQVYMLILLMAVYRFFGSIMGPAWGSLISDYLPPGQRGAYFGRRARAVGLCGMLNVAAWAGILHLIRPHSERWAFFTVFLAAFLFRVVSCRYMFQLTNLPEHHHPAEKFTWNNFLQRLRRSNFARFTAFAASMSFSTQLSGVYISVHMLRDLGFDYPTYMTVHLASSVAGFLTFPVWGRHADRVGTVRVLRLTSLLVPVVPLCWALAESPLLLAGVEFLGGFIWGGFSLCMTNFIYDSVPAPKRVRALGYFNLINGFAIFLGASLGGWLADRLPPFRGHSLNTLFLLSAAMRFLSDLLLSRGFQESRPDTHHASHARLFFSVVGLRPLFKGE